LLQSPPKTEYSLTTAGRALTKLIHQIHELDEQIKHSQPVNRPDSDPDPDPDTDIDIDIDIGGA